MKTLIISGIFSLWATIGCIQEVPFAGQFEDTPDSQDVSDIHVDAAVCVPGVVRCSGAADAVLTCNAEGTAETSEACGAGAVCQVADAGSAGVAATCVEPVEGCPTVEIAVAEGPRVVPQTTLRISAQFLTGSVDQLASYQWTVDQPSGSVSVFLPTNTSKDTRFAVNTAGEYTFHLKVWDANGVIECPVAPYTVLVASDAETRIRVELVWDTPGDADQTDAGLDGYGQSVGSDLDLHFLHPLAEGRYFGLPFDTYWQNSTPNWDGSDASKPVMTRDDTDGAGPETIVVVEPEEGAVYRVGVHYWDDYGFGRSFATIRIYIYGQLREQWSDVKLVDGDLWDALTIEWPSTRITRLTTEDGGPIITPDFDTGIYP